MPKPYIPNDSWSQKAREDGYRARSVYKLIELDLKFKVLKPGMTVLDLGAAPGSWMQYELERVGPKGKIIGMDLQEIEYIADNVHTYVTDIESLEAIGEILQKENVEKVDLVLSDLAPSTSGIKDVDQWRSVELSQAVTAVADEYLRHTGKMVIKVLRGADFDEFLRQLKTKWKNVRTFSARASRDRSKEIYVIATKQ